VVIGGIIFLLLFGLTGFLYHFESEIFFKSGFWTLVITFVSFIGSFFVVNKFLFTTKLKSIDEDVDLLIKKKSKNANIQYISSLYFGNKEKDIKNEEIWIEGENKGIWKDITNLFSDNQKNEVYNLAKQNNLIDNFVLPKQKQKISKIFFLSHFLEIIYAFKDSILNIAEKDKTSMEKKLDLINQLIFSIKLLKYRTGILLSTYAIIKIIYYLSVFILITILSLSILFMSYNFLFDNISYKEFEDIIKILFHNISFFSIGISLIIGATPLTYLLYNCFKMFRLRIEREKHDEWRVLFKNILIYSIFFIVFILIIIFGFYFLIKSGKEYQHIFNLFQNLFFPIVELKYLENLKNILHLVIFDKTEEFIPLFIALKTIFIIFISFLGYVVIKHYTEKYLEFYDNHKEKRHMVPPEFIRIFSYLVLFIIVIILLYGTLFVNYPDLIDELNNKQADFGNAHNNFYSYKEKSSIKDYLPLSIFLAIFGAIATIATKDLLENYFAGLSLKINSPYEEGERVTINGEMMEVKSIGFRADKFYGINTNTEITIPHKKLVQSTIVNYTKPTLDYRKEITIFVPDQKNDKNIPRKAEMVLLLATFISTGVKKPRFKIEDCEEKIKAPKKVLNESSKNSIEEIENCEEKTKDERKEIWDLFKNKNKEFRKNLFLEKIQDIVDENETGENKELEKIYKIIKKIVAAIIATVYEFEERSKDFNYHLDEYCIKRKFKTFQDKKKTEEFKQIAKLLVNINYYYFALASQIWHLKNTIQTNLKKIQMDRISLQLLDVPRVTSAHKKYEKDLYWEITLLVTVELGEQSDEIIHHINMHIDDLWELFDLPIYYQESKQITTTL